MPLYRIGNVFMPIKFTCNTHLFVVLFLFCTGGGERETFVADPSPQVVMSAEKDLVIRRIALLSERSVVL